MLKLIVDNCKILEKKGIENLSYKEFIEIITRVLDMIIIDEHIKVSSKKMKKPIKELEQLILTKREEIFKL